MNTRYFNRIEILDENTIKKSSTDIKKLKAEYIWFQLNKIFSAPNVFDYIETPTEASYKLAYVHGHTFAYHFLKGDLPTYFWSEQLKHIKETLDNSSIIKVSDYQLSVINSMYLEKTIKRLHSANIPLDVSFTINDYHLPSIEDILKDCPVIIKDSDIRYIHGDLCLSNMLLDESRTDFGALDWRYMKVIDPRGLWPDGTQSNIGDVNYDVAKLAHSFIGRYDQIVNDKGFDIEKINDTTYTWSIQTTDQQSAIEKKFIEIFKSYDYYNIMIHLFFSMIPLHKDRPDHQEKMLVNALRLYLDRPTNKII